VRKAANFHGHSVAARRRVCLKHCLVGRVCAFCAGFFVVGPWPVARPGHQPPPRPSPRPPSSSSAPSVLRPFLRLVFSVRVSSVYILYILLHTYTRHSTIHTSSFRRSPARESVADRRAASASPHPPLPTLGSFPAARPEVSPCSSSHQVEAAVHACYTGCAPFTPAPCTLRSPALRRVSRPTGRSSHKRRAC
jgi:hypothetical protein